MIKRICIFILYFCILSINAFALHYNQPSSHVDIEVIPQYKQITPSTKKLDLLLKLKIKPNWHIYWKNPGDIGNPTTLNIKDTPYYEIDDHLTSTPKKIVFEDIITSYVHENTFYILQTLNLKNIKDIKQLPIEFNLSYDACYDECINENIGKSIKIPLGNQESKNPSFIETYSNAETTFPQAINHSAKKLDNQLIINLPASILKDCKNKEFVSQYPKKNIISSLPKTVSSSNTGLNIIYDNIDDLPINTNGLLLCDDTSYYLTENNQLPPPSPTTANKTLLYHIIIAFIAGLILNLMPCVLPIISLKALQIIKNAKEKSLKSAFSYMFGVISSFIVLASILFYFKKISSSLGWGFQLQSIGFNLFLLFLFFIIFLSLIDKIHVPDIFSNIISKIPSQQNFITGFFAVIVATPCTGPFMGTAIGYAMLNSTIAYFSIFIALGFGYALPYTLIELNPKLITKYLPKPGHWMITLKYWLSIPIALTCLWLGWVIFSQLNLNSTKEEIDWVPYSEENINKALNNNQNVFINFTAKWCLVCMLNDKTTLSTSSLKKLAKQKNIILVKADWTNKNDNITKALEKYNRNSIPLYVYIKNTTKEEIILPQILTTNILEKTF